MLSIVRGILLLIGAHRNDTALMGVEAPAACGQFLFVLIAFCALTYAYVVSDFSIALVAQTSHTLKPMLYKLSGVWGNHEGSMLLWIRAGAVFMAIGGMVSLSDRRLRVGAPNRAACKTLVAETA